MGSLKDFRSKEKVSGGVSDLQFMLNDLSSTETGAFFLMDPREGKMSVHTKALTCGIRKLQREQRCFTNLTAHAGHHWTHSNACLFRKMLVENGFNDAEAFLMELAAID